AESFPTEAVEGDDPFAVKEWDTRIARETRFNLGRQDYGLPEVKLVHSARDVKRMKIIRDKEETIRKQDLERKEKEKQEIEDQKQMWKHVKTVQAMMDAKNPEIPSTEEAAYSKRYIKVMDKKLNTLKKRREGTATAEDELVFEGRAPPRKSPFSSSTPSGKPPIPE
ncbi:hypothetical protein ADUPG1_002977, partial [Aduncisulcus paluster]